MTSKFLKMALAPKSLGAENCSLPSCNLAPKGKKATLSDINPILTCVLCGGYFIDATTIIECLHSFCKSCIVKYLDTSTTCPICDVVLHKTKPFLSIRSDTTLQDIVYKLVPGLFKNEMKKRREYFAKNPEGAQCCTPEEKGETENKMFYTVQDEISLSLEYGFGDNQVPTNGYNVGKLINDRSLELKTGRRYLLCPAGMQISHLKKFIVLKYTVEPPFKVDIMYLEDVLSDDYNLMDVAYIYSWRRNAPLRLFYRISQRLPKQQQQMKVAHLESQMSSMDGQDSVLQTKNNKQVKKIENPPSSAVGEMRDSPLANVRKVVAAAAAAGNGQVGTSPSVNCAKSQPSKVTTKKKSSCSISTMTEVSSRGLAGKEKESKAIMTNGLSQPSTKCKESYASGSVQTEDLGPPAKKLRKILPANSGVPMSIRGEGASSESSGATNVHAVPSLSVPKVSSSDSSVKSSSISSLSSYRPNNSKRKSSPAGSNGASLGGPPSKMAATSLSVARKYSSPPRVESLAPTERTGGNGKTCEKLVKSDKSEHMIERSDKGPKTDYARNHTNNNQRSEQVKSSGANRSTVKVSVPTSTESTATLINKSTCNSSVSTPKTVSTVTTLRNIRVASSENRKIPSLMISKVNNTTTTTSSSSSHNNNNSSSISCSDAAISPPRSQSLSGLGYKEKAVNEKEQRSEKSGKTGKSDNNDKTSEKVNKEDSGTETQSQEKTSVESRENCDVQKKSNERQEMNSSCVSITSTPSRAASSNEAASVKTNATSGGGLKTNVAHNSINGSSTNLNLNSTSATHPSSLVRERKVPSIKISTSRCNESGIGPRRPSPPHSQLSNNISSNGNSERHEKSRENVSSYSSSSSSSSAPSSSSEKHSECEPKKMKSSVHSIIEYLQESKRCPKSPTSGSNSFVSGNDIGVNFHSSVTSKGITIVRDVNRNSVASSSGTTVTSPSSGTAPVSVSEVIKTASSTPSHSGICCAASPKKGSLAVLPSVCKEPPPEGLPVPLRIPKLTSIMSSCKQQQQSSEVKVSRNPIESRRIIDSMEEKSMAGGTPLTVSPPPTPSPKACEDSMLPSPSLSPSSSPIKDNAAPLDLSFGSSRSKTINVQKPAADKYKLVSNPPVLDKHRFLCPPRVSLSTSSGKHPSFKISPSSRPAIPRLSGVSTMVGSTAATAPCSKREQTICSPNGGDTPSNALGSNSLSRSHHHHHHHRKPGSNLTVITPDHGNSQKIVIKKLDPR